MLWDQTHLFVEAQIILRIQPRDPETERTVLEYQVSRPVVIDELPDIAALMIQRPETLVILKRTLRPRADCDTHPRELVAPVIQMEIHNEPSRPLVVIHLWPLEYPMRSQLLGIFQRQCIAHEFPMQQVS